MMSIKQISEVQMLRKGLILAVAGLVALSSFSCSEVNKNTSPILLDSTVTQTVQVVDLKDAACPTLGTIVLRAIVKRADVTDLRFLDVHLTKMAVSYQRTDGGKLIPQPFVESISGLLTANGGDTTLNNFFVFQVNSFTQAPFAALLPNNGGHDPDTGLNFVKMDVIMDIFGQTLSGEKVSTRVRFPLTFCNDCGGCR
jgi:hypothetical protein